MKDSVNCIVPCGALIVTTFSPTNLSLFPVNFSVNSVQHKIDWFGTLRGRFGYTTGPAWFYVTGGLAYGSVNRSAYVAGTTVGAISGSTYNTFAGGFDSTTTKVGWTLGGGAEAKLFGNWSAKAEYLYMDLGSTTDVFNTVYVTAPIAGTVGAVAATRTDSASFKEHIFRAGLNYKFGG